MSRVENIKLQGEDAKNFKEALFNPSEEDVAKHESVMKNINETISITRTDDGYIANIADLDLQFVNCVVASSCKEEQ